MKTFVAESYSSEALAQLRTHKQIQIVDDMASCEALLIRSQTRVGPELLKRCPSLRFVVTATSGFDHIDWKACQERGVVTCFTPEANAGCTAELTLFLMSALLRGTLRQIDNARKGRWREGLVRGDDLEGQTLGIIGLGRVGSRVAKLARAYGMNLVAHDPYVPAETFTAMGIERLGLIEVLRACDVLTLHVPLTRETKHLINHQTLAEMPSGTCLINASRGAVVDESEVLVALRERRLRGAAFDVLEREPPLSTNELLSLPQVIVTPHAGAFTAQAFDRASRAAVQRLMQFVEGQAVPDSLPLTAAWFGS